MLAVVALALASAPETYLGPPDRLERLLPAIGAAFQEEWRASQALRGEVAVVRVRDVRAETLRAKLAEALQAEWERDGGAHVLVRRKPMQAGLQSTTKALAQSVLAQCRGTLRSALDATSAGRLLEPLRTPDERARSEAAWALSQQSAQVRLLCRILLAAGEEELAQALASGRAVFDSKPNRMQRQFPGGLDEAFAAYQKESEAWEVALSESNLPEGAGDTVSSPGRSPVDLAQPLRLVVSEKFGQAWVNLLGQTTGMHSRFGRQVVAQRTFPMDPGAYRKLFEEPRADDPPIRFSEATLAYIRLSGLEPQAAGEAVAAARARALDPVAYEPLAEVAADALAGWADAKGCQFVAHVPDAAFGLAGLLAQGATTTVGRCDAILRAHLGWETEPGGDGWLTPRSPQSSLGWADRAEAKALIARSKASGTVSLEDYARLVVVSEELQAHWPLALALAAAPRAVRARHTGLYDGYRIVAALSPDKMARLRKGEAVTLAQLEAGARKVVNEIAFRKECHNEILGEDQWSHKIGGPPSDPTDACPNGLPETASLTLRTARWPRIATMVEGPDGPRLLNAWDRYAASRQFGPEGQGLPREGKLLGHLPVYERVVYLRLTLKPGVWHEFDLSDGLEWPKAEPVPYGALPEEFRKPPPSDGDGGQAA